VSNTYEKQFGKGKSKITVPFKVWQVKVDSDPQTQSRWQGPRAGHCGGSRAAGGSCLPALTFWKGPRVARPFLISRCACWQFNNQRIFSGHRGST